MLKNLTKMLSGIIRNFYLCAMLFMLPIMLVLPSNMTKNAIKSIKAFTMQAMILLTHFSICDWVCKNRAYLQTKSGLIFELLFILTFKALIDNLY